ncbi:DISARM system helicase DrmA [Bacillus smithii]|uniref:DISARM system helicase DrmA n=1 Tax=Bacillus smithii TaxID=1479 RepID=UPI0030C9B138
MKPGAKKLLQYLKENGELDLKDIKKVGSFWTDKTTKRFVEEYRDVFVIDNHKVKLKTDNTPQPSTDISQYIQTRSTILSELENFLVGPFEENETLGRRKTPMSFYLTGKLVPFGSTSDVVNEEENHIETKQLLEDEAMDEMLIHRHVFRPSAMGFSFKMKSLSNIKVLISWGMYDDEDHKRTQLQQEWCFVPENKTYKAKNEPAQVRCKVKYHDGLYHVSLFLMNRYERDSYPKQSEIMFQTKMIVEVPKAHIAVFSSKADINHYEDELLYGRHFHEYAVGHGVGVDWREIDRHIIIESKWLPFYEIPVVEHRTFTNVRFFMKELSEMDEESLRATLTIIPDQYEKWLCEQKNHISTLPNRLKQVAERNVFKIEQIINRIREGIHLIISNTQIKEAFQFANKVMMIQQAQSKVSLHYRSLQERIQPKYTGEWRLFQIAFLLMNIAGVVDRDHEDREVVDLIWFPTGGGKTEAYLGLAAFTMGYRRLIGEWDNPETYAGVTIFMRYTLRLLTTQQFQRAAAMICAAEFIRQKEPEKYGIEPFRIGLWIGQSSSPNTYEEAIEKMEQIKEGNEVLEGSPMQLTHCPWCGTELIVEDYHIDRHKQVIRCHYYECPFSSEEGIPVLTIDEAIYQYVPTILIGTVDKVAQVAWKKDMYELFGRKTHYSLEKGFIFSGTNKRGYKKIHNLKPPELIIQDELHLISGPLGSLTGLYELAVDYLCQYEGRGPKIVASTATIRGADEQIRRLYGRKASQFPLPVLKATDNFVSYEVSTQQKPGRLYVGICAPGVSGKIHAVQVYAALLTINEKLKGEAIDPYWTILGYFNTVKELAGTTMLFKDEIPVRLKLLNEKSAQRELLIEEMTSRRKAREIPQLLSQMEKTYEEKGALNAVLATNMISVGVDVNRLGVMVVHGQPKTTSEYIQATSRVGRSYPGLVLTLFNSLRPRDLSHYERFKSYHSSIYRFVEPTSVTPFAHGSLRRGLTGVLVGTIRQGIPAISKEQSAKLFERNDEVEKIKHFLIQRAIKTGEVSETEFGQSIEDILEWWIEMTNKHDALSYRASKYNRKPYLLKPFGDKNALKDAKPAMHSLRSVETEIKVVEWKDRKQSKLNNSH